MDSSSYAAIVVGAIIAGTIFGVLPLALGMHYKQNTLGWIGFASCIVGSFVAGLFLSIPCCIVFTVIILAKKPKPGINPQDNSDVSKPLTVICPNCSAEVEQGYSYCGNCGASLSSSAQRDTDDDHYIIG